MLFRVHARDPSDYHFFSSLPTAPSRGLPWRKPNGIFFADVLQEAHRVQHGRQHRCLRSFWMLELYLALKKVYDFPSSGEPQPQLQNNRKRHDIEQEKQHTNQATETPEFTRPEPCLDLRGLQPWHLRRRIHSSTAGGDAGSASDDFCEPVIGGLQSLGIHTNSSQLLKPFVLKRFQLPVTVGDWLGGANRSRLGNSTQR